MRISTVSWLQLNGPVELVELSHALPRLIGIFGQINGPTRACPGFPIHSCSFLLRTGTGRLHSRSSLVSRCLISFSRDPQGGSTGAQGMTQDFGNEPRVSLKGHRRRLFVGVILSLPIEPAKALVSEPSHGPWCSLELAACESKGNLGCRISEVSRKRVALILFD